MKNCQEIILRTLRSIQMDLVSISKIEALFDEDSIDAVYDLCSDIKDYIDDIIDMADKSAEGIDDDE